VSWLVAGAFVCIIPIAILYVAGVRNTLSLLTVPFLVFALVGWLDRAGRRIRMALAEVAWQQRQRWKWDTLPVDRVTAESWLATHPEAPVDVRASVMTTAGRDADARSLLDASSPAAAGNAFGFARLGILFAAEDAGDHSIARALEKLEATPEFDDLPADERRYQLLCWRGRWRGSGSDLVIRGDCNSRPRSARWRRSERRADIGCSI
jgi:hypothetical protein